MGKGSDSQTVTQRVEIPDFLQPLVRQQARTGKGALWDLQRMLGNATADDLVAGFSGPQQQAFDAAERFATGQDGFLPTAQNAFLETAQGSPLSSFLNPAALQALTGSAGGQSSFLPDAALETLSRGAQGGAVPTQATDAIGNVIDAELLPQATRDALTSTAEGDFLFGGEGFDAAVDAAMRSARPQLLSTFGRAGSGGGTGGLAQTAIAQAAQDAFARQFANERANQLSAAQSLGGLEQAGRGQRLQAAGLLGDLGLSQGAQQLQAAGALGDFASQERGRQLSSAGQLAGLSDAERSRQLSAAGQLPQLGLLGSDVLSRIGEQQQALEQQRLLAPISAQQQLLGATGGGVPLGALLGQTQTTPTESSLFGNILGGASTGFELFGPWGALGGGLLGGVLS